MFQFKEVAHVGGLVGVHLLKVKNQGFGSSWTDRKIETRGWWGRRKALKDVWANTHVLGSTSDL